MDKNSVEFINTVIEKVRNIDPNKKLEDGSVALSISDSDIKTILDKKVLRNNVKPRLEEDLKTAGIEVNKGYSGELEITIPKDKIETNVIRYSDL